jgi:hypothetical protein
MLLHAREVSLERSACPLVPEVGFGSTPVPLAYFDTNFMLRHIHNYETAQPRPSPFFRLLPATLPEQLTHF